MEPKTIEEFMGGKEWSDVLKLLGTTKTFLLLAEGYTLWGIKSQLFLDSEGFKVRTDKTVPRALYQPFGGPTVRLVNTPIEVLEEIRYHKGRECEVIRTIVQDLEKLAKDCS